MAARSRHSREPIVSNIFEHNDNDDTLSSALSSSSDSSSSITATPSSDSSITTPTTTTTDKLRKRHTHSSKSDEVDSHSLSSGLKQKGQSDKTPASPKISIAPRMFSSRKYTPLPTSSNGSNRKRAGGGMTSWKRYALIGTAVLVLLGLGYTQFGGNKKDILWDEENTYTPALDDDIVAGDGVDYSSPPFRPLDSDVAKPASNHQQGDDDEDDPTFHALPIGHTNRPPSDDEVDEDIEEANDKPTSSPHDPTTAEAQGASHASEDFTEVTDSSDSSTGFPASFEDDPNPSGTTACSSPHSAEKPIVQYALTIDAGSTGSRIHVYKFNNCGRSPQLEYETFKMLNPGLSAYARDPTAAAASLDPLLKEAYRVVPKELWKCTPVEVKATAGLRLLGQQESVAILDEVRNRLETNWDFVVNGEKSVEIMDGKDEGVYAWITANYLLGKIGEGVSPDEDTLAVMDLGGASTQIVFEPKFPVDSRQKLIEGEHKYQLNFGGKDFTLYQHSYLGYGLMRARRSVHNLIAFTWSFGQGQVHWDEMDEGIQVPNPCLTKGSSRRVELDPPGRQAVNVTMHGGNGGFEACNRVVELVMAKDAICEVKPCSFNGVYQPSLLDTFPRGQLLALSYFTDRIKPLFTDTSLLTISDLTTLAKDVCAGPEVWSQRFGNNPTAMAELEDRPEYCLDLTFMNALLGLGYELSPERQLMVEKKLKGVELGWALGAGLALVENAKLTCTA
ncbi:uncharacterized protein I303_103446 [Kwoniella dejecticola CBS 10117]|uniref:guanosine-diphosphatase n=1 Tax=Kwoniella dejecticola CBS 10117 TaxID=1296121 RepID=A0A1A6A6S0_9TREE|nr:guanosine-diphosphatase [Kwoniella dejecticola CBS 10117]OBR85757.1 guanosine-diphosphatase [Kwoniella dejecticola CBS 10117]